MNLIKELKIDYIFQISLSWLQSLAVAFNGMRGENGITVKEEKGVPVIRLGDTSYNFRPIYCAKPTFDGTGNLTNIEFYTVMGFCAIGQTDSTNVVVEECTCA